MQISVSNSCLINIRHISIQILCVDICRMVYLRSSYILCFELDRCLEKALFSDIHIVEYQITSYF